MPNKRWTNTATLKVRRKFCLTFALTPWLIFFIEDPEDSPDDDVPDEDEDTPDDDTDPTDTPDEDGPDDVTDEPDEDGEEDADTPDTTDEDSSGPEKRWNSRVALKLRREFLPRICAPQVVDFLKKNRGFA